MLKIRTVTVLMLAIVIPTAVRTQPSPSTLQLLDDPEAYKVYAALLPEEWTVRSAHAKTLVFREETVNNPGCLPSGKPLENDWLPVLKDFTSANVTPKLLRPGFDMGMPYIVVPFADIRLTLQSSTTYSTGGWDNSIADTRLGRLHGCLSRGLRRLEGARDGVHGAFLWPALWRRDGSLPRKGRRRLASRAPR